MLKNSLKMRVPKRHPKKHSKNRFWEPFWPPKSLRNRRKILSKTMLRQGSKKRTKKSQLDPNRKIHQPRLGVDLVPSPPRPVIARNGKSAHMLESCKHAIPRPKTYYSCWSMQPQARKCVRQRSPAKPSKA
jgi:hypothetical protein